MASATRQRIAGAAAEHGWSLHATGAGHDRWRRADGEVEWEVFVEFTARGGVAYASLRRVGRVGRTAMFKGWGKADQVVAALASPQTQ